MAKQYEKELYDLLVKTDALCNSEPKEETTADINTETKISKTYCDPLTDLSVEQPLRNYELEGDEELMKVMVEPLEVAIPKYKQSDDELLLINEELDSGAVETQADDPDFECKPDEGDDSSFIDNEDDDYVPQKRKAVKLKKLKKPKTDMEVNVKMEVSGAPAPKKRGRKPKNKDGQEERKPRRKREKKTYECKDCEKVFEKLVDFVVTII